MTVMVKDAATTAVWGSALKKTLDHFNGQDKLFVFDGAAGSSSADFVNVRTVADSAAAAQGLRSLLFPVSLRLAPKFAPALTVLHASSLRLPADGMWVGCVRLLQWVSVAVFVLHVLFCALV